MIVYQTYVRTCVPVYSLRTRCIFTAAAHTPAHGETGVRKPLANTDAHTHAVSLYTSYHHPCYSVMIIIRVSQVVIIASAVIRTSVFSVEQGVMWLNFTTVRFVSECFKCNLEVNCMDNRSAITYPTYQS